MAEPATATTSTASQTNVQSSQTGTEVHTGGKSEAAQATEAVERAVRKLSAEDMDALVSLNIGGKVQELPLREVLKKHKVGEQARTNYEKRKAEFDQAIGARQQIDGLMNLAKTNPRKFLEISGQDPYAFSEATLTEKLKMMEMSPEARRAIELENKLRQVEAEKEEFKRQHEQTIASQEETRYAEALDHDMTEAFAESGLPKHKWYVQMAANEMIGAVTRNESLSPKEAIAIVKEKVLSGHLPEILKGMQTHQLLELLGPDVRKAIREFEVQSIQHQGAKKETGDGTPTKPKQTKRVFRTDEEYRQWIDSLKS